MTRKATFAQSLKRLRQRAGLTQQQLADRAGLHQVKIAELESGRTRDPRWRTVVRLADALGVGVEEFGK